MTRWHRRVATRVFGIAVGKLLAIAAICTLLALALMVWSLLVPTVLPVMLAMTGGQILGTLAFAAYIIAIVKDRRAARAAP